MSLLSGGERSLTAMAFLFAIFTARPSPFYLMDEVEPALDDVNLHRFLRLVEGFASESQVMIVTHQKRTMEIAGMIYGVSLPGTARPRSSASRWRSRAPPAKSGPVSRPSANGRRRRSSSPKPRRTKSPRRSQCRRANRSTSLARVPRRDLLGIALLCVIAGPS